MTKYHARRTLVDGHTFDSKAEAARYQELKLLERAGQIRALTLQKRFPLDVNKQRVATYIADFEYIDGDGNTVVEDVKGVKTPVYNLKKKLVRAIHGIEIREITK